MSYKAVQAAMVGALVRTNPLVAAKVSPKDPDVRFALAMMEFRLQGGRVREELQIRAADALRGNALAEEPFLLSGISALARGDETRGEQLLLEARRRNPRSRMTRLVLLDRFVRTGRTAAAIGEIAALSRLVGRAADILVPELARMAMKPDQRKTVKSALQGDPKLLEAVLARLAASGADPDLVLDLGGPWSNRYSTSEAGWQAILLRRLVEDGNVTRAYQLWRRFTGTRSTSEQLIYDSRFAGEPGLPPFNWRLSANSNGAAERVAAGGLNVVYYGREEAELAAQLLMLAPGQYRIQFTAEGDASGEGSRLVWRLRCHGAPSNLTELPIRGVKSSPSTFRADFRVPVGCGAQWLTLAGVAAEFPSEQSVVIRDLQLLGPRS